jgi:hypothetical protein
MMQNARCTLDEIWEALGKIFDHGLVERYRSLAAQNREEAFRTAKTEFRDSVAEMSPHLHDINGDGTKQHLIFGHLILAILDGIGRGVREWRPFPHLQNLTWSQKETALLLWSSQHGTSDEHSV